MPSHPSTVSGHDKNLVAMVLEGGGVVGGDLVAFTDGGNDGSGMLIGKDGDWWTRPGGGEPGSQQSLFLLEATTSSPQQACRRVLLESFQCGHDFGIRHERLLEFGAS